MIHNVKLAQQLIEAAIKILAKRYDEEWWEHHRTDKADNYSKTAKKLTQKAKSNKDIQSHIKAYWAHQKAKQHHENIGNGSQSKLHGKLANYHLKKLSNKIPIKK